MGGSGKWPSAVLQAVGREALALAENRFFVDEATGMMFRDGDERAGKSTTTNARYEVSQIRKNE